jgi:hypothetical protein
VPAEGRFSSPRVDERSVSEFPAPLTAGLCKIRRPAAGPTEPDDRMYKALRVFGAQECAPSYISSGFSSPKPLISGVSERKSYIYFIILRFFASRHSRSRLPM